MEVIKKVIQRITTTGITTGCTGMCRVIIPDLTAVYHFKINLVSEIFDWGFFDAYIVETGNTTSNYDYTDPYEEISPEPEEEPEEETNVIVATGIFFVPYAARPLYSTFAVKSNRVIDNGGFAIVEYGILYTQNPAISTAETLLYNTIGIEKDAHLAYIAPNTTFTGLVDGVIQGEYTYFRAYAKNQEGEIGYGVVKVSELYDTDNDQLPTSDGTSTDGTTTGGSGGDGHVLPEMQT